jgi:hypothetical protein
MMKCTKLGLHDWVEAIHSMNGQKRPLVTDELWILPRINQIKIKDHNMEPVGPGNTGILTSYAQHLPEH